MSNCCKHEKNGEPNDCAVCSRLEIQQLQAELDKAIMKNTESLLEIGTLQTEVKALKKYARHSAYCEKEWRIMSNKCTCGYEQALESEVN